MAFGVSPAASFKLHSPVTTQPRVFGLPLPSRTTTHDLQVYRYGNFVPTRPTFIVVMGRGQAATSAEQWVRENTERYNIFVYDQPYQGLSSPVYASPKEGVRYGDIEDFGDYPQHLDNIVNAVSAFMKAEGADAAHAKPHLFGHSLGGWTVKRYNQMERYRGKVATVQTSSHMARIEVRPQIVRRVLGEDAQLWTGLAVAECAVEGLVRGYAAPASDPERSFAVYSKKPWGQTTAPRNAAEVYAVQSADYRLQTNQPTVRWALQGMLAALGLHLPWRRSYAPEFHIIASHDVISDPAYMKLSARTAAHGAYVAVEGMLHDGFLWPAEVVRDYSALQYAFATNPETMRGEQALGEPPRCDPTDRARPTEFFEMLLSRRGPQNRKRHAEAAEIIAKSKAAYEHGGGD